LNNNREELLNLFTRKSNFIEGYTAIGGIHCVLKIRTFFDDESFVLKLLKEGKISVHPGYYYDIDSTNGTAHIIISLLQDTTTFKKALKTIEKII
jgi:aspartate/methionine/tyrosine aminotransferase